MIDEKGRLFGKINIVDLLVLIVIVVLGAVLGVKLLGRGSADGAGSAGDSKLIYTVQVTQVKPSLYEEIKKWIPGDQLVSGTDLLDGCYVTAVASAPHQSIGTVSVSGANGSFSLQAEETNLLDLTFTIEANVGYTLTNLVGIQEVRVGKSHYIKTKHIELNGTIQSLVWEGVPEESGPTA